MEKIFQILPVFAQSDSSVLITGETGTGKNLAAEAIHQTSNRLLPQRFHGLFLNLCPYNLNDAG